ncbi:tail tape measure protein [Acinetobacter nosocomialis P020]|uniref:tape measure protein n=1 Tax=Acinetobacter nosocomialis TaxID=106654 RepID=UPI000B3E1E5A|nr:tape measure protein [Acinetobacter nosocomialis]OUT27965.1 tail tape measure protein [Acinetobacter nosocomialis P020]
MAQESRLVIVVDAKNAERNARNLGNELDSIERKGDFATKSMDALSVATRQLAGYMAGLVTVSAAISKMDTYTGLQNRLKLVTNNQVELNKATEDTFRIAQKTYSAWDSVLQVYQRFSDNAKTLNLTMDDTARLTETVSKAVAISGASASAADAALVQFGQALASGTLRGEELNSVMEQTPALAKAIAQGMGITVGELRSVAAEGKITSQEIVKALRNVEKDVDALFAKTDITIGQSLTLLNNEITKFVGEAGKGSGAAQVLSGSIQTLAGNLDTLTNAMMIGGAYWLGTYIPAIYASGVAVVAKTKELAVQTVTQYAAIQAERAAAAQQVISTQAAVANTQATLAAIAAEKALEVQRLKSQITEKGRTATLTRMAELKKIEAQVTRELAVAEEALAVAQSRSAAAGAATVGIGSRLLGLLGGPVGIGITVASLAAGYLLMRDNGDKANDMLEKQSRYAGMAADELMKLEGAQKRAAEGELTKQLSLQNAQLSKSQNEFLLLTQSITDNNKQSAEAYRIWAELKTGVIDVNQAFNRLNQLSFISSDQINQLADSKKKVDENSKAVKQTNAELNQVRASGANAKAGFNDVSQGAKGAVQDVTELNKKLQDLQKTYAQKNLDTDFSLINIKSHGLEMGKALSDFYDNNKIPKTRSLTKDEWAIFQKNFDKVQELKKLEEDIADSKRQQTKESAKQAVLLAGNNERVRNMLRVYQAFRNAGLGDKQARVMTAQVGRENDFRNEAMFGSHKDENNGYTNTGFISWQKTRSTKLMQSLQGQGVLDKNGKIQQTQDALDAQAKFLLQEVMTNKSYSKSKAALLNDDLDYRSLEKIVGKNFIGWDYEGKKLGKDKASQHLAKQDSYYNQLNKILGASPDAASKVIGDLSKFEDEAYKARAKTLEEIKQLQASYDSDSVARSKKVEEEINKATILGQTDLIPKIKERFDAEDKLAQKQFDFEVNGYKWTEEQKLEYTKETSALRLVAEGKLSKEQLDIAKEGLDQQYQHELELINLTKAARQAAYDQANLKALQELKQERDILAAPIWQRAGLSLQFGERNALSENDATLINKGDEAKMKLKQKEIDQLEYNKRIEDAVRIHEENKFKIQEEYAQKYQDLQQSQHQTQLELYGSLLSQASTVWGSMTEMVKSSAGEQSSAYKAMFLMQQAIAIGQAIISTELAATKALELGPVLGIPASTLVRGMGYASVGLIAAQTIAGFSDGGYTGNGLKHTPAGIVHKGEVVWSQEDIKRWGGVSVVENMRQSNPNGYANGGYVSNNQTDAIATVREHRQFDAINSGRTEKSQPTVTIINKTSEKVDATSEWDGKELTVILKEYQKQNEAMVDAKIEKRFRMSKRQGW